MIRQKSTHWFDAGCEYNQEQTQRPVPSTSRLLCFALMVSVTATHAGRLPWPRQSGDCGNRRHRGRQSPMFRAD